MTDAPQVPEEGWDKDSLLFVVDTAISQLYMVRKILKSTLPEQTYNLEQVVEEPAAPAGPHDGHDVIEIGFGGDLYCKTCAEDVGVSPAETDPARP